MSWRQPTSTRRKLRTTNLELRTFARGALVLNFHHLSRMKTREEGAGRVEVELGVARFDDEEELVLARAIEVRRVEDRMIRPRQAIQREHADDGGERPEQDRGLER